MSLFTVDQEKCKKDGICVDECPVKIIEIKEENQTPTLVSGAEDFCIRCGHCVAVCPHGALSHKDMKVEDCPPVNKDWLLGPDQAEHFLRNRRSIRTYKNKPVDRDTLSRLIKIASYAPSGHNFQPVKWHVIYDHDELNKLIGMVVDWMRYMEKEQPAMAKSMHFDLVIAAWEVGIDTVCRSAPHVIIAHGAKADPTAQTAATIAMTYLELAALPLGLGACWAGFLNIAAMFWPPMQKALALPEGHGAFGSMMVGYPKYKYHRLPLRNEPPITWK